MLLEVTLIVHLLCVTIYMYWPLFYSSFVINDHFNSNMCLIILLGYSILIYHQTEHNINTFKESDINIIIPRRSTTNFYPYHFKVLYLYKHQTLNTNFPKCTQLFINYNKLGHFVGWLLLVPVEETTTCNLPQVTENLYQVHLTAWTDIISNSQLQYC